jgi:uncharacterized membrane protein YhaH (DUF805 family)
MNIKKYVRGLSLTVFFLIFLFRIGNARQTTPGEDLVPCGAATALCGSFIFIIIAIFVLNIALLVWVAKDAKNRGMGSSVGWIFLILFTGVIGLIIYLFSRPQGELIICEVCSNKKLKVARICPHCGCSSKSIETKPLSTSRLEYCPNCGGKIPTDALFCDQCGGKIER